MHHDLDINIKYYDETIQTRVNDLKIKKNKNQNLTWQTHVLIYNNSLKIPKG